ncbi:MAG: 4-alpha-glucanotransferase [Beggiatoa sp. IS2]|nr:MAG: 4-alpha-glucanotransferase [Beggiatoa sp. IS2]
MINNFLTKRRAGILLHPTSLPSTRGNGDLGHEAYRFVDFLHGCGITVWQVLPIGQPHGDLSPYQCQSVHAANTALISLEYLWEHGWLPNAELPATATPEENTPEAALPYRQVRLQAARAGFMQYASIADRKGYADFVATHANWLEDYALYRALKMDNKGLAWWDWPAGQRDRKPKALSKAQHSLAETIEQQRFEQYLFFRQWQELKQYANEQGIYLFGDIPIFVASDSADVWAHPDHFLLNADGKPTVVAGVPPDYFSKTGQYWGNPHYNWDVMQANGFQWWIDRLHTQSLLFDLVRIDHFRGFEACWAIPANEDTAVNGQWVKVPGEALFMSVRRSCQLPLVAEDLGVITPEVEALRDNFGFPGMKILQFAFYGDASNPYLPHNHIPQCVVYTGTHDNDTTLGWFQSLTMAQQQYICDYLHAQPYEMPWPLVAAAFASVAELAIIPMQDVLSADSQHRMNTPGTVTGNWRWRFDWSQVPIGAMEKVHRLLKFYGRG